MFDRSQHHRRTDMIRRSTAVAVGLCALVSAAYAASTLVINEVYGGGGNSGAPFNQDYVELFNNGGVAVDISGFQLQYTAATTGSFTTFATIPSGTFLQPGDYYVVTLNSPGANGVAVPNVDQNTTTSVNIAATGGRVQLLDASSTTIDFVGWGTAITFEGTAAGPATSNTTSVQRFPNGTDTDQNGADFKSGGPNPGFENTLLLTVPEPSTWAMMLCGAALLVGAQRFRRKV